MVDFPRRAAAASGLRVALAVCLAAAAVGAVACAEISTDPKLVASIAMDTLPYPSIVANDSLRDSLGVARPLHATVYNIEGTPLASIPLRFRTPDSGATVDSIRGYVIGDTARSTVVRLIAEAGTLQAAPDTIYIVPSPDTVIAINATDSLLYSLTDTTAALSNPLQLQVLHRIPVSSPIPVRSYLVSYRITYPADTLLAQLVTRDGSQRSIVDTTAADGTSARRIRLRTLSLTSAKDSVVVLATVRYRGAPVAGTPLRFVLQVKPQP
ncbi:MAG TPA: hypothetical protein VII66_10140 [Gemmatimonadaceae bacterium]